MKKKTAAALGVLALLLGILFLLKPAAEDQVTAPVRPRLVAAEGKVEVRPGFEVELGSEVEGKIAEFPLKEGDQVTKGEVIARMENRDIQARLRGAEAGLAAARARLKEIAAGARAEEIKSAGAVLEKCQADCEFAEASLHRYRGLFARGIVSKQIFDDKERQAKTARALVTKAVEEKRLLEKGPRPETLRVQEDLVQRAEAQAEYWRRLLDKTLITAPISGKLIRKYLDAGESATKERALAAIADLDKIWVNAEVDETDIGLIRPGDPVEVKNDAFPDKPILGEVEEIADYAGPRKVRPNNQARNLDMKVVQVKVRLPAKTYLKPGLTVEVKIKPSG
jgi:multidrug resistance efflux pump